MSLNRIGIAWVCCLLVMTVCAAAQARKPGLWELTTTTTTADAAAGPPHTSQFCVTQQYFDKYGAILPAINGCRVTNLTKKANGMTGEMVCTGAMNGKITLESSGDAEHATGKVHFVGSVKVGQNSKPTEWTSASSGTYKGADCGSVKPLPMRDE